MVRAMTRSRGIKRKYGHVSTCEDCSAQLVEGENWCPSCKRKGDYLGTTCRSKRGVDAYRNNPKAKAAQSTRSAKYYKRKNRPDHDNGDTSRIYYVYVWFAKCADELFQPHRKRAGTSALPNDFRTAATVKKGHGRLEKRTIMVSSLLADYSTWPELAQVFKLENQRTDTLGTTKTEIRYGVTSLPAALADPKRLLELTRGQWGVENGLQYRRDATLREDHSQLRMGHAPQLFAALNNTALGLLARQDGTNVAQDRREFAYQFDKALHSLAS